MSTFGRNMSGVRAFSSPELSPPASIQERQQPEDHSLEGIATNVKLLLKIIQDHNEASTRDVVDERKAQRVAGMMSIIEDVKTRIQKSQQTLGRKAELRRCNTDVRTNAPKDKKAHEPMMSDEKEKLRRQLSASLAARKSLEIMCTSLGKEKEIMAVELARKVQELSGMEELIGDLRAQNDVLMGKVKACAAEHKEKKETNIGNTALQERNRALSEQLLKSLDGYRSLKRKLKDSQEENMKVNTMLEEMEEEIQAGLGRIQSLKERIASGNEGNVNNIDEEISVLENLFKSFNLKITKNTQQKKKIESPKSKSQIKVSKAPVLT